MNRFHTLTVGSLTAFTLAWAGCTPGKEDPPPKPKVTATAPAAPSATGPAASSPPTSPAAMATLPKLGAAPAWQLADLDGKPVSSEQFKGKVLVVDFWATWCPPCRAEIPGYTQLQAKYGKDGFAIVGISLDQAGVDVVKAFATSKQVNYAMVMGDEKVVAAFGGVEALPTTFLIDRHGQIRDRKIGAEETADYEKKVAAILAEKSPGGS